MCRKAVKHIVARLTDPNAPRPPELGDAPETSQPIEVVVPAHLQDLKEGDLPEGQRVAVLDQIAVFREASARRDREKKRTEEEKERFKAAQNMESQTADYGYGSNRGLQAQIQKERTWGTPQTNQPQTPQHNDRQRNPQGYDEPVNFVKAQAVESKEQSERTDEEEEMMRQQRKVRDRENALKEVGLVSPWRLCIRALTKRPEGEAGGAARVEEDRWAKSRIGCSKVTFRVGGAPSNQDRG